MVSHFLDDETAKDAVIAPATFALAVLLASPASPLLD
jgi:hypothetical protein